jgi:polysaccharide export outer membrane protein
MNDNRKTARNPGVKLRNWKTRLTISFVFGSLLGVASLRPPAGSVASENASRDGSTAEASSIQLCQALGPAAPHDVCGVDCLDGRGCGEARWNAARSIPWQAFGQGEYVGHDRTSHVDQYRLRVDDRLELRYRLTREESREATQLSVGDQLRIESFTEKDLNREVTIQPDGTITVPLIGRVPATRRTAHRLRDELDERYKQYVNTPAITVTPLKTNTKLQDLLDVVDARYGSGGQALEVRVAPDGTVALPGIGSSIPAQSLTLDEFKQEIDERYTSIAKIHGVEVTPALLARAPRFVYVLGEVAKPDRYELEGPTTVMQALALAGSWNVGANLRQVVVFRRGDDWRLMATKLNIEGALYGKRPCPADEIWINDSDVIVVPKHAVIIADEWIEMIFTRGIYGVVPFQGITLNFSKLSSI